MKRAFLIIIIFSLNFSLLKAAESQEASTQATSKTAQLSEDEAFRQKINDLINKRREISMAIYQTRVDLINTDPNLKILHQAIMDLHEKMANELNANPKIVTKVDKGNAIDREIAQAIQDYQAKKAAGGK